LLALKNDLQFAWERGYRRVLCTSASTEVIRLISEHYIAFHEYKALIDEITSLMLQDWMVRICLSYREANACTDFMEKLGAREFTHLMIWEILPPGMGHLLLADSMGHCFSRAS